jgi:hypothetical protein
MIGDSQAGAISETPAAALTPQDVQHNMRVLIAVDAIFTTGAADLSLAMVPLWVFLGASSSRIGSIQALTILGLAGILLSPFLSVRFRYKKWYLFVAHLPYIGTWGVMGIVLLLSHRLGLSNSWLLAFLTAMFGLNAFFGGFVGLPKQEYTVACLPMSYLGRFSAYSQGIGSVSSIASTSAGYWILNVIVKPLAWGYLYVMAWFFCQLGFVVSLFGRERPTLAEETPRPWLRDMIREAWRDKPFLKLMLANAAFQIVLWPLVTIYVANYGYSELGMAPKAAAVLMMITNVSKIALSGPVGHLTDRLHPTRVLPYWPLAVFLSILPVVILKSPTGVYIGTAIGAVYIIGQASAFLALIYGLPRPENRSGHYTIQMIQSYVSLSIGPLIVGRLCDMLSFRTTFLLIACISLALCPLTRYLLSPIRAESDGRA